MAICECLAVGWIFGEITYHFKYKAGPLVLLHRKIVLGSKTAQCIPIFIDGLIQILVFSWN